MALPQGINFRQTSGYVSDPAGTDYEVYSGPSTNYPRTSAQGNNVGWETNPSGATGFNRNRNATVDPRLAGCSINFMSYRIDVPSAGSYNIRLAMGDASYSQSNLRAEFFDTTTSLGVVSGSTTGSKRWLDATGVQLTDVTWPTSNTALNVTLATTIFRTQFGVSGTTASTFSHLYIESASSGTSLTPSTGHLVLTGYMPSITRTANVALTASTGHLVLTGYVPSVARTAGQTLTATTGHLALTGYAPSVSRTANQALTPSTGHLVLTGYQPSISVSGSWVLNPGTGHLTLTGYQPSITQTNPQVQATGGFMLDELRFLKRKAKKKKEEDEIEAEESAQLEIQAETTRQVEAIAKKKARQRSEEETLLLM